MCSLNVRSRTELRATTLPQPRAAIAESVTEPRRCTRARPNVSALPWALSSAIRTALQSDEAYRILDESRAAGSTWTSGGCLILAHAILAILRDGVMVAVYEDLRPLLIHHFAVLRDGLIWDGDGCCREDGFDEHYRRRELIGERVRHAVIDPARPFASARRGEEEIIPQDLRASDKLATLLRRRA